MAPRPNRAAARPGPLPAGVGLSRARMATDAEDADRERLDLLLDRAEGPYGKGGKYREVEIHENAFKALALVHGTDKLDGRDASPILPGQRGQYTRSGLWRLVHQVVEKSGIDRQASCHWMRHSYGSLAAKGGATAMVIKDSMGHARLDTSQQYIHMAFGPGNTASRYLPDMF